MILTSGCFDGFHAGHVQYLHAAYAMRQHEDEALVIAVAPDAYIRGIKGRAPRWTLDDRLHVLHALSIRPTILVHDGYSVASIIRDRKPRLFVKGDDWRDVLDADILKACKARDTEIRFVPLRPCLHNREAVFR